jgi:hypothetical protein
LIERCQHFAEYLNEEEAIWRRTQFFKEFDYFVEMYFAPGRNKAQLAEEAKVDRAIITRILEKDESKRMVPSPSNLLRICAVLYNHKIIPSEADGDRLFSLLRYATPTEVRKTRMQTTEQRAVVKPVTTDELPPAPPLPDWAKPQAQFNNAPHLTFDQHC